MIKQQAFLITAYKDFEFLLGLTQYLCINSLVYIHVDKKSKTITDDNIKRLNSVEGCKAFRKYDIAWGGFCHVLAIKELMEMALQEEQVGYIHCITGEDYPVMPVQELHRVYSNNKNIYLSYIKPEDLPPTVTVRYKYYNLFPDKNVKNPFLWQLQNFTVKLQKILGIRRKGIGEFKNIYKGLVYISLPRDVAEYVRDYLAEHPKYLKDLRRCQVPEEFFFHTIILNSEYISRVVNKELRYMNWSKGDGSSPSYLDMEDYEEIINGEYTFARKFHPKDSEKVFYLVKEEILL